MNQEIDHQKRDHLTNLKNRNPTVIVERRWDTVVFIITFHLDSFAAKLLFLPEDSLRLWEWPLASKCVIIVCLSTACLTGWPSDLLHLLMVPWWLWRDQTAHSCRVSKQQPAGWTTMATRHQRYECVILEGSAHINKAGGIKAEIRWQHLAKKASVTHLWMPLTGLLLTLPEISLSSFEYHNC